MAEPLKYKKLSVIKILKTLQRVENNGQRYGTKEIFKRMHESLDRQREEKKRLLEIESSLANRDTVAEANDVNDDDRLEIGGGIMEELKELVEKSGSDLESNSDLESDEL